MKVGMKTAEEKVNAFLKHHVKEFTNAQERALILLLKEQDRDTRHACAGAVLTMDEPLDPSAAPKMAHDICMNVKAV